MVAVLTRKTDKHRETSLPSPSATTTFFPRSEMQLYVVLWDGKLSFPGTLTTPALTSRPWPRHIELLNNTNFQAGSSGRVSHKVNLSVSYRVTDEARRQTINEPHIKHFNDKNIHP